MLEGAERKRTVLLFGVGTASLAVLILALSTNGILSFTRALNQGAPTVPVTAMAFGMPFLALTIAGWSYWFFRAIKQPPPAALEARLIRGSLMALALLVAVPLAVGIWVTESLPARGYAPCPDTDGPGRFRTETWTRDPSLCPGPDD